VIRVSGFHPNDARRLDEQISTRFIEIPDSVLEKFRYGTVAHTIWVDEQPMVCFGAVQHWEGREEAWALFDSRSGAHFPAIVKILRRYLDARCAAVPRMEATCERAFRPAHRLLEILGFELETDCIKSYYGGRDFSMYRRLNNG